jgi:broad specificity phosphatase PhoE
MSYWSRTIENLGGVRGRTTDVAVMSQILQTVYMARHGETAWSLSGQHTGLTDLPLTDRGELEARELGDRLRGMKFAKVLTSPLQRATETCALAGFETAAQIEPELVEWDYGKYEGLSSAQAVPTE